MNTPSLGRASFGASLYAFMDVGPTFLYNGFLDEVSIWNRALSSQEISNLYNNGAGMSIVTP